MSEIQTLVRQRGSVKHKLTSFNKFIDKLPDQLLQEHFKQIEIRLEAFKGIRSEFEVIQGNIDLLTEEKDIDDQLNARCEFDNSYYDLLIKAKGYLDKNISSGSDHLSTQSAQGSLQSSAVKLPVIQLPKFNGDHNSWLEFRDTFSSLINDNNILPSIQKYHYLRSCLEGTALDCIRSLEFSADGYDIAWQKICKRYNNSRNLIRNHVKAILTLPITVKENFKELRSFIDTLSNHLLALKSLNQPVDNWDTILLVSIVEKLDKVTAREWETKICKDLELSDTNPTIGTLLDFLNSKASLLEQLEGRKDINIESKRDTSSKNKKFSFVSVNNNVSCFNCKQNHLIYNCTEFLRLNPQGRIDKARELKLCTNCLRNNHTTNACKSYGCKYCNGKHNSLLHIFQQKLNTNRIPDPKPGGAEPNINTDTTTVVSNISNSNKQVLLPTALVKVKGNDDKFHLCRALLDSGSQSNFISEQLATKLNVTRKRVDISLIGINSCTSSVNNSCTISVFSNHSSYNNNLQCYIIDKISTRLPAIEFNSAICKIPNNINLADPNFNVSQEIELLIGASVLWNLVIPGNFSLGQRMPTLQNTALGWIVSGDIPVNVNKIHCNFTQIDDINQQLQRFWEIENVSQAFNDTVAEEFNCDEHFTNNLSRNLDDGKFIVKIPFNNLINNLGNTNAAATQRLLSIERKFEKDPIFRDMYKDFMNEYLSLGHMTRVTVSDDNDQILLPHHGVVRSDSSTTKLRVVFDGSARTSSGISLNQAQHVGPTIQNDLMSIILRFRVHQYVIIADIKQMYRQVIIHPDHRKYQRILWRNDHDEPIQTYELNTVTYGTASAPYLAIRCLFELASENQLKYPKATQVIKDDFYVDDMITGDDNPETLIQTCKSINNILKGGGFELRKFISNKESIANSVANSISSSDIHILGCNDETKTLGVKWNIKCDTLIYSSVKSIYDATQTTKRKILSATAKIFDPLGLICPIVVITKLILQRLWASGIQWDDPLPESITKQWQELNAEFKYISDLNFPRCTIIPNATKIELHGFSDASKKAYGAAIYLRSFDSDGNIHVKLLCAKSRVAPLKEITIPRLELCGALLLVQLMQTVRQALSIDSSIFYWTDSQVVLHWINMNKEMLNVFVSNRVEKIQSLSNSRSWYYINTKLNPADIISRGATPKQLGKTHLWWSGPPFLLNPETMFHNDFEQISEVPETKRNIVTMLAKEELPSFPFENFSNLGKLVRVTAYILRFKLLLKSQPVQRAEPITPLEYQNALNRLIKIVQLNHFELEIKSIQCSGSVNKTSKILNLAPFLDEENILRVGGRLGCTNYNYDKKYPVILPKNHHLSMLILRGEHIKLMHAGSQHVLSSSREQYWIMSGKPLVKKIIKNCITCFKFKTTKCQQLMGNLPKYRATESLPFMITGVDYAGPFFINNKKGRGAKKQKCYVSVFVCFATKCVHLETVVDLSTECFIATLRRFVSRRGLPSKIYSDNGRNFVGAENELKNLSRFLNTNSSKISQFSSNLGIEWKFIPPYTPHFGGLWESAVKSMKSHLYKVMSNTSLTYDEFETTLVQIEAILNSRPLYPLSDDPTDYQVLTPSHFLIGRSACSVPDPDITTLKTNHLSRYQYLQRLQQEYWNRWRRDYLNQLQVRTKWKTSFESINIGALVLLNEPKNPTLHWKVGRVIEKHPGQDGKTRVISLQTPNGIVKRSIENICPFPQDVASVV